MTSFLRSYCIGFLVHESQRPYEWGSEDVRGLKVYCRTVNGETEYYALDPELRKFFEERCHQFMDVNALLKKPAVSKAIENIRAEDSRTIVQLQGEKQELECEKQMIERHLSVSHGVISQLNGLRESFEKAPVWRRLWIALFPSEFCACLSTLHGKQ